MKRSINLIIIFLIISLSSTAQLSSISTSGYGCIHDEYKTFIILDETTGYVMAKTPIAYNTESEMPLNYFTLVLPSGVQRYIPGNTRIFLIHNLFTNSSSGAQDWVLENNVEEESVFYARNKYITNIFSKQWLIMIDGEKIVFKNIRTKKFLSIDEKGNYFTNDKFADATRWKLIHSF